MARSRKPSQRRARAKHKGIACGKIAIAIVVIAALTAVWRYTPLADYLTAERITGWARAVREQPWAPLLLIGAQVVAAFTMFPRPLLTLFAIICFGAWLGFAYTMLGVLIAALITYGIGRAMSPASVKRIAGDHMTDITRRLREHGLLATTAIRFVPAAPFAVEGIVAGACRVKVWEYSLGTFIGMAPGTLLTMVFGTQLTQALEDPSRLNWWIIGIAAAVFAVFTFFVGRWLSQRSGRTART